MWMSHRIGPQRQVGDHAHGQFTSCSRLGGKPPHPDTQSGGNDKCHHAHPHAYAMRPDHHLGMIYQSQNVPERKKCENYTRDA